MWGMLGDFYNQISIQILRICEKTKDLNGGLLKIDELISIFNRTYPNNQIDRNDVIKAVENVEKLGNGCKIIDNKYISTVPFELSNDQIFLMKMSERTGYVSEQIALGNGWTKDRFDLTIVSFEVENFCRRKCCKKDWCGLIDKRRIRLIGFTSLICN